MTLISLLSFSTISGAYSLAPRYEPVPIHKTVLYYEPGGCRSARPASQSSELSKKGESSKRPGPFGLGATGQRLEWSAGADDRLNAGIGPAANSNNNVRGDMPFDEPFGAPLQRSLQLAVFLLGPQRCR